MPKQGKQTLLNKRHPAGDQGLRPRLERVLKWVGGITAILSLVFGLHQMTQLVSNLRERQRHIAELYKVGKLQQSTADYEGAWASFEQALKTAEEGEQLPKLTGQLGEERRELRKAQEDLAREWLENVHVRLSEGQTFSNIVDKLVSVLSRGATSASGARKADLLAHVGWANFLRWRDGHLDLNPEQQYRQALEIDPANPYAHAHWGHWKLWQREKLEDTRQHFSTAIASGRARDYVRRIQLAALKNFGEEGDSEFLTVVNDMRKNNEKIDTWIRNYLDSIYYFACSGRYDAKLFTKLLAAVPATEQLATFQALFYGAHDEDFDKGKRPSRDACLATLLEAAGQREEALRIWLALRQNFPPKDGSRLGDRAQDEIKRLSPRANRAQQR
jgi:hypothetical protein